MTQQILATLAGLSFLLCIPGSASAVIDPKCRSMKKPKGYDEQTQQDFLQNYFALATTYSPLHAPVPHEPGHGSIALELAGLPPLGCDKRYVLDWTKTEDTNKSPIVPRPRIGFSLPAVNGFVPYASVGYFPPVPVLGTRNVILSGEFGVGRQLGDRWEVGLRYHAAMQRTIGDIATKFNKNDRDFLDYYQASTFGVDAQVGARFGSVAPYVAAGFVDASTVFFVADDDILVDNLHPYAGPAFSVGVDGLVQDRYRLTGEFYGAPGGHTNPGGGKSLMPSARYGQMYTARVLMGVEL